MRNLAKVASLLALFSLLLVACGSSGGSSGTSGGGSSATPKSNLKVALVTDIGGLNDNGFNHLAYTGYQKAEKQYGFKEKVIQTTSQNDYVTNLTQAAQVADLVVAVGFLMQQPLDSVAKQYPSKKFGIIDGCATDAKGNCDNLPNVAPLFFKEQEAGCLVGAIAGQMEADGKAKIPKLLGANTILAVGGLDIPPVDHYIAGYKYCAQKVDPSVKVLVNFSQSFTDTAKCKDIANSRINSDKADIVFQVAGGCGVGSLDAANSKGVYGIGVDADQGSLYPSVVTSALKRVDTAVYDTIKNTEDGNFSNNPPPFDLAHDGVGYANLATGLPDDVKAKAEDFANQIKSGSITIPDKIS
ncbi:MAG: BMP family ABC transporter substrate-binding protein [Ktedonobacteraceae bacterium]